MAPGESRPSFGNPTGHDIIAARCEAILMALRAARPRIHAITSPVAQALTANGVAALGAHVSLTVNTEEIQEFIASSDGLLLNLGMLDRDRFEVLPMAAALAREAKKPFVIDPVYADRSPRRRALARSLFAGAPRIVKVNQREAEAFSRDIPPDVTQIITGSVDVVRHGKREARLANGHVLLEPTTATGCLLGAVLAATITTEEDSFVAAIAGVSLLNIAAEIAGEKSSGPGSFAMHLVDSLANLDGEAIHRRLKIAGLRDEG
jgi:hydroxyethylthiazole kinase